MIKQTDKRKIEKHNNKRNNKLSGFVKKIKKSVKLMDIQDLYNGVKI